MTYKVAIESVVYLIALNDRETACHRRQHPLVGCDEKQEYGYMMYAVHTGRGIKLKSVCVCVCT